MAGAVIGRAIRSDLAGPLSRDNATPEEVFNHRCLVRHKTAEVRIIRGRFERRIDQHAPPVLGIRE
jgi:hypothetical protein